MIQSDPVTCSRHFDFMVQTFIRQVLKNSLEPVGRLVDFFYRVEFQQRGCPHIHMLLRVENAPKLGSSSHSQVADFIDKYLSCSNTSNLPDLKEGMQKPAEKRIREVADFPFPFHQ